MARSVDRPDLDHKRRAPPPEDWRKFLPPPSPRSRDPYAPVPIIPAPIDVDPPSRPPEYMFGPPHITQAPAQPPLATRISSIPSPSIAPGNLSGGLLGMMERSGVIDPSAPDAPTTGGLLALLQEYLRNNRVLSD
jgi:hypothetical protein